MLAIKISLILLVAVAGCNTPPSMNTSSQNHDSINSSHLNASVILSRDIIVFIGRGGCCYGHIISIDRKGNLKYSVGTYHLSEAKNSESSEYLPETLDLNSIEVDKKYSQKYQEVSVEKIKELARLMQSEEELRFQDKGLVYDDYLYQIYFDNKRIAYGYSVHLKSFPIELQELITLVVGQVELHKLPGMA